MLPDSSGSGGNDAPIVVIGSDTIVDVSLGTGSIIAMIAFAMLGFIQSDICGVGIVSAVFVHAACPSHHISVDFSEYRNTS